MTLGKDIAADASQKAANQVRPSEEELSQIDQAAEENVWHEKPNISKDDLKSRFKKNKEVCILNTPLILHMLTITSGEGRRCFRWRCSRRGRDWSLSTGQEEGVFRQDQEVLVREGSQGTSRADRLAPEEDDHRDPGSC